MSPNQIYTSRRLIKNHTIEHKSVIPYKKRCSEFGYRVNVKKERDQKFQVFQSKQKQEVKL